MNEISPSMSISYYSYELPDELIAQEPLERREGSRMLVVNRASGRKFPFNADLAFQDARDFARDGARP